MFGPPPQKRGFSQFGLTVTFCPHTIILGTLLMVGSRVFLEWKSCSIDVPPQKRGFSYVGQTVNICPHTIFLGTLRNVWKCVFFEMQSCNIDVPPPKTRI